jgi:hypothetical protein
MRYTRSSFALFLFALFLLAASLTAEKKKNPDDMTQTLALPQDPPAVAIGDTRRLVFRVSPLSGKGLLSQQTRDALKGLLKENSGAPVIHIRAFVAGNGDMRRVPQIVSEVLGEKHLPLPSVSVVLAGGLPLGNAQVVLESVSEAKREVNPSGLTFVAGEVQTDPDPGAAMRPLLERALARLDARNPLLVTCYVSSMTDSAAISSRFPGTPVDLVQAQRSPCTASASCEAVERGSQAPGGRLAFTGTHLAFQRLDRDLGEAGADPASIVMTHVYTVSQPVAGTIRGLRPTSAPMTVAPFEGIASLDATFAVDAVALLTR